MPKLFDPSGYFQSSALDIIGKDTKEKITAMMEELSALGASISLQIHDEIYFDCVPGTEEQVAAIHEKYFPRR
jgi:DNA polymerase I-like protein with 3'-5' exonuclease and polymerase domains